MDNITISNFIHTKRRRGNIYIQYVIYKKLKLEREGNIMTEVLVNEVIMNIIDYYKIGSNQVRITRYYPQITRSCRKYLIEI